MAAPDNAQYLLLLPNGGLAEARTFDIAIGSGLQGNDSGAGSTYSITTTGQLGALNTLATTGLIARTATNTVVTRSIISSGGTLAVTNPAGIAGNPSLDVVNNTSIQQVNVSVGGVDQGQARHRINFINGVGATVTASSNGGTDAWDITVAASGGGGGGGGTAYVWVSRDTGGAFPNQVNLGALTTGIVGITVSGASATPSIVTQIIENTTSHNLFIGTNAGNGTLTGTSDVGTGYNSLHVLTSGQQNTATGSFAGAALTTGSANALFGDSAGRAIVAATDNTLIGNIAGALLTTDSECVAIGSQALSANVGVGNGIIAIGYNAAGNAPTGINVTLCGWSSGQSGVGNNSTAFGYNTLPNATIASVGNTVVGSGAGSSLSIGNDNVFMGFNAGAAASSASFNVGIGTSALGSISSAVSLNTAVGHQSMMFLVPGGGNNTAVGYQTMQNSTVATGSTAIGHLVLSSNINGVSNTGVGDQALANIVATSGNTALGFGAGNGVGINALSNCTFLGTSATTVTNSLSNASAIGASSVVNASNTMVLGNASMVVIGDNGTTGTGGGYALNLMVAGGSASAYFDVTGSQVAPTDGGVLAYSSSGGFYAKNPAGLSYHDGSIPTLMTGLNGTLSTATLDGVTGSVTVNTTSIKVGSYVFLTRQTLSGTPGFLQANPISFVPGVSFVIQSTQVTDSGLIAYWIVNPS